MNPAKAAEILNLYIRQSHELLNALRAEYASFRANDISGFEAATSLKLDLSATIQTTERQLYQTLEQDGYPADQAGLNQYVDGLGLQNKYKILMATSKDCQKQNQINARMVNLATVQTQQFLNLLQGREPGTSLYSAAGKLVDNSSCSDTKTA